MRAWVKWAGRWFAIFVVGIAPASFGATSESAPLTLTGVVAMAVRENVERASLRAKWEAMEQRPAQVAALPNPMLKYGAMDSASGGKWPDTSEKRLMIEQEFPSLGKRGLREQMAVKEAEVTQQELEALTREVAMQAKENFYKLAALRRALAIAQQEEDVLRQIARNAENKFAAGEASEQDALKAAAEITMLHQRLLDFRAKVAFAETELNTLLNRPADAAVEVLEDTPAPSLSDADVEGFISQAVTNRSEIRAAELEADRYELEKQLMRKEGVPDVRLGLEYRDFATSDDMVMLTVGIDLPVWRGKVRAGVLEAERMKAAALANRDAMQRRAARDVQDAWIQLRTARENSELYRRQLVPQGESRFRASEAAYQTGRVDFMELLESERFLLNARVMSAMAEGDVGMAIARLERAAGTAGISARMKE